jgi:hypothetical protein
MSATETTARMSTPRMIGLAVALLGLIVVAIGAFNMQRANEGLRSLDAVYAAQDVTLSYNEDGRLIDRGTPEGAAAIMTLLADDWAFPVNDADLDPNDPLVNTPTELMFQYATITYHVLNGTQTVVLDEAVEYEGETFAAGTYEFEVDGRYWTMFDRQHPIEGPARGQAWEGANGILASISSGVAADYAAGFAHFAAWRTMVVGLAILLGGFGLAALTTRRETATAEPHEQPLTIPDESPRHVAMT